MSSILGKYEVKMVIEKDRYIYDGREMMHVAYEVEEVRVGDRVRAVIVETKKIERDGEIACSLANSKI